MSDEGDQRRSDRRTADRRASGRALVPAGEVRDETPSSRPKTAGKVGQGDPAFSAQLLGQDGQKRGLRGGAPVLNAARSAYLETEYSGVADRRPRKGGAKVEDI